MSQAFETASTFLRSNGDSIASSAFGPALRGGRLAVRSPEMTLHTALILASSAPPGSSTWFFEACFRKLSHFTAPRTHDDSRGLPPWFEVGVNVRDGSADSR